MGRRSRRRGGAGVVVVVVVEVRFSLLRVDRSV